MPHSEWHEVGVGELAAGLSEGHRYVTVQLRWHLAATNATPSFGPPA